MEEASDNPFESREGSILEDEASLDPYELTQNELKGVNERHKEWLKADVQEAEGRANFTKEAILSDLDLSGDDWTDAFFTEATLRRADLTDGKFEHADFKSADLTEAILQEADCSSADFSDATLYSAKLDGSTLVDATFADAEVRGATFIDASMGNTVFRRANLTLAKFSRASGRDASFEGANLKRASFPSADLSLADFSGASLEDVDFSEADLSYANFSNADLTNTDFTGANLEQTDFTSAQNILDAYFADSNLDRAKLPDGVTVDDLRSKPGTRDRTSDEAEPTTRTVDADNTGTDMTREELKAYLDANEARVEQMTGEIASKLDKTNARVEQFTETLRTEAQAQREILSSEAKERLVRFTSEVEKLDTRFASVESQSRITRNVTIGALTIILTAVIALFVYAFTRMDTLEERQYDAQRTVPSPTQAQPPAQSQPSPGETAPPPQGQPPTQDGQRP